MTEEKEIDALAERGLHPVLNCPHLEAARAMYEKILAIRDEGDSSGGVVEVVATGVPGGDRRAGVRQARRRAGEDDVASAP